MTKQKKLKAGDVVGWLVVDRDGDIYDKTDSRENARNEAKSANKNGYYKPYRVAKIVLT